VHCAFKLIIIIIIIIPVVDNDSWEYFVGTWHIADCWRTICGSSVNCWLHFEHGIFCFYFCLLFISYQFTQSAFLWYFTFYICTPFLFIILLIGLGQVTPAEFLPAPYSHASLGGPSPCHCPILRPPGECRRAVGCPRTTWLRTIDDDLQSSNFGVHTTWRKARDRDVWHQVVSTATLGEFANKDKDSSYTTSMMTISYIPFLECQWLAL